jgi:drug/metabolite transporter (DMT)-like permease
MPFKPSAATVGILLILASNLCLAGMDATSKSLVETYGVGQILWVSYVFFAGFAVAMVWHKRRSTRGVLDAFKTQRPWLHTVRALLLVAEMVLFSVAFAHLKLATVPAIAAICPLLITALSAFILGEAVTRDRWIAVGMGFVGMMIILHPGFAVFDPWSLLPLTGAALFAVYQVLTKTLERTDSGDTILLYTGWVGLGATVLIAPFHWINPDPMGWVVLGVSGLFGVLAQILLIKALAVAEASVLQPFNYTLLVFTTAIGILAFAEYPSTLTLFGGGVIVCSGIYGWWRERVRTIRHDSPA